MDRTPQPVLRVDDVHKDFGRGSKRKKVLKGLSFEVPEEALSQYMTRMPKGRV